VKPKISFPDTADCRGQITALRQGSAEITDRASLLMAARAGKLTQPVVIDALTFIQRETPNRNFVRFAPRALRRVAKTLAGVPFLRDHRQNNVDARGGTVVESTLENHPEGQAIRQTIELTKPWAQEAALDGTLDRFSIGWRASADDVVCSVCENSFFGGACTHFPGDEVVTNDGAKKTVEMMYMDAEGVETSAVNVPAVVGTGVDGIRAQLSAARKEGNLMSEKLEEKKKEPVADRDLEQELRAERERVASLAARLEQLEADSVKRRVMEVKAALDPLIERAKAEGKIIPKRDDKGEVAGEIEKWIREVANQKGIAAAEEMVASMPRLMPIGVQPVAAGRGSDGRGGELSAAQKSANRQLGIKEETFRKYYPDGETFVKDGV